MRSSTSSSETRLRGVGVVLLCGAVLWGLDRAADAGLFQVVGNETFVVATRHRAIVDQTASSSIPVLLLGDSSLRSSVDPEVFEAETGLRALNLGLVSGGAVMTDFLLARAAFDAGHRPELLILVHTPASFGTEPDPRLHAAFFPKVTDVLIDPFVRSGGPSRWMGVACGAALRTCRHQVYVHRIFDLVVAGSRPRLEADIEMNRALRQRWATLGYMPDSGPIPEWRLPSEEEMTLSSTNAWYLRQLMDRAKSHETRVLVAFGPMLAGGARALGQSGLQADLVAQLSEFDVDLAMQAPPAFEPHDLGGSTVHANERGARRFTRLLARALEERSEME